MGTQQRSRKCMQSYPCQIHAKLHSPNIPFISQKFCYRTLKCTDSCTDVKIRLKFSPPPLFFQLTEMGQ